MYRKKESPWITRGEACRRLGISSAVFTRLVDEGRVGYANVAGVLARRYSARDVDGLLVIGGRAKVGSEQELQPA